MLGRHQNVGVAALLSSSPSVPFLHAVLSFWGLDGQIPPPSLPPSPAPPPHTTPHPPKLDTSVMSHALPSVLARVLALARAVAVTLVTVVVVTSNCHNTSIRHHAATLSAKLTEVLIES